MSTNVCNGETGEKSPATGDLNWKLAILAKIARGLVIIAINSPDPWRLTILAKMAIVAKLAILANHQKCMQWRKWQKIASLW